MLGYFSNILVILYISARIGIYTRHSFVHLPFILLSGVCGIYRWEITKQLAEWTFEHPSLKRVMLLESGDLVDMHEHQNIRPLTQCYTVRSMVTIYLGGSLEHTGPDPVHHT